MRLTAAVVGMTLMAAAAQAYELHDCHGHDMRWPGSTVTIGINDRSFPAGRWRQGIDRAVQLFNDNPSNFTFSPRTDPGDVEFDNGQNEIWGTGEIGVLGGAPAATFHERICAPLIIPFPPFVIGWVSEINEEDIVFDYTWATTSWRPERNILVTDLIQYGGDDRMMQATAIHELGHAAGLAHENDEYNVMGTDFEHLSVNNWFARAYLGEDAADGLVDLYGAQSNLTYQDLGVVHWAYHGPDGEYSDHRRVRLYTTGGGVLPTSPVDYDGDGDDDETRFRVSRLQRLQVEFTYENNGASRHRDVRVGFFLSDDAFISTADTRIGGARLDLSRDDVYTARHTVTMPSTLVSGQDYWIGAVIDEGDDLSESYEWNNATYIPVVAN